MSEGSVGKGDSESSTRIDIPDFLRPFLNQATGTSSLALSNLARRSSGDLAADLTPDQLDAIQIARERAGGEGGFIPTAQQELLDTAQGASLSDFLPESALSSLMGFGGDLSDFISPDILSTLTAGGSLPGSSVDTLTAAQTAGLPAGSDVLASIGADPRSFLPSSSLDTISGLTDSTTFDPVSDSEFRRVLEGELIPAESREALLSTARGDFLFGGEGFDAAVDAATRAALPQIRSVFGRAGAGGAASGLAQTAVGTAAADAFARQFADERTRQLAAAGDLAGLDLAASDRRLAAQSELSDIDLARNQFNLSDAGRRLSAAGALADIGLSGRDQSIDAANLLGGLDLSNRGLQVGSAESLANLGLLDSAQDLESAGLLANLSGQERDRELSAVGLLSDLADNERNRQLAAVDRLPGAATLDTNLLQQIGAQLRGQEQLEIDAPLQAQLQLLIAALNGLPISSLLGQSTEGSRSGFSLGFGP